MSRSSSSRSIPNLIQQLRSPIKTQNQATRSIQRRSIIKSSPSNFTPLSTPSIQFIPPYTLSSPRINQSPLLLNVRTCTHTRERFLHTSPPAFSGLTNIFDTQDLPSLSIAKLTDRGFHLSDDLVIPGGVIFIGGRAFLWDVDPPQIPGSVAGIQGGGSVESVWQGWTKDRFKIFENVVPRPEILILGTGKQVVPAPKVIKDYVSSLGIQLDVMDSRNAASTYNLLFEEGRTIGAALCPLRAIDPRTGKPR